MKQCLLPVMVPVVGLEPTRGISPTDFESVTSTIPSHRRDFIEYITYAGKFQVLFALSAASPPSSDSTAMGINIRFMSVGVEMPGTVSSKLYCHISVL